MKSLFSLLILAQGAFFVTADTCNADNCVRAITGTAHGVIYQATAKKVCSSFLQATLYPATVTSTASTTIFPSTETQLSTGTTIIQTSTVYPFSVTSFITTATDFESITASILFDTESTQTIFSTIETTTVQPQKRDTTSSGAETVYPTVPVLLATYASDECIGTSAYSSACSCFGATPTTVSHGIQILGFGVSELHHLSVLMQN